MKINELITKFTIAMSNEEAELLGRINTATSIHEFSERERVVIEGLVRKSLLSKINRNGNILVVANA
jgi:hypothetical protein